MERVPELGAGRDDDWHFHWLFCVFWILVRFRGDVFRRFWQFRAFSNRYWPQLQGCSRNRFREHHIDAESSAAALGESMGIISTELHDGHRSAGSVSLGSTDMTTATTMIVTPTSPPMVPKIMLPKRSVTKPRKNNRPFCAPLGLIHSPSPWVWHRTQMWVAPANGSIL